jgi:hypothetical protein
MTKALEMRKLLALMVLFCGTASAGAAPAERWCSKGFDQPAELVIDAFDPVKLLNPQGPVDPVTLRARHAYVGIVLKVGARSEAFNGTLGMVETEMTLFSRADGKSEGEELIKAQIFVGHEPGGEIDIVIFRDRVFWPCDKGE